MIASTAAFFALFGYHQPAGRSGATRRTWCEQSADRITDVIVRSTHYEMLHNDRDALYNIIQELGSEPGIQRIRIFNKEGRITYSTDPAETGTVVDKSAEACYRCHAQSAPLAKLQPPRTARACFTDKQGQHLLAVIRAHRKRAGMLERLVPRARGRADACWG